MHAPDEKPVEIFNTLIGINNNRIECYRFAGNSSDATILKTLFSRLVDTSLSCNRALTHEVYKLGGVPYEGTLGTSPFFKGWLQVHEAIMNQDRKQLVEACYDVENVVQRAYCRLMNNSWNDFNAQQQVMLSSQLALLKEDLEMVDNLRSVYTTAA